MNISATMNVSVGHWFAHSLVSFLSSDGRL